jgi:hypothetical protein
VKWEDSIHADASLTEKKETNDEDINSKADKNITIRRTSGSPFIEHLLKNAAYLTIIYNYVKAMKKLKM